MPFSGAKLNLEDKMEELSQKKCQACEDGQKLAADRQSKLMEQLGGGWKIADGHHLEKEYKFKDFKQALDFTNKVGAIAEEEGHHPDIYLTWGKVRIQLFTHTAKGLTENDFILAAKIEEIGA